MLKPSIERKVQRKQDQQKSNHDKKSKSRQFSIGDEVFARNHGRGETWLKGIIIEKTGPVSFKVQLDNDQTIRCHQDHIRKRVEANLREQENEVCTNVESEVYQPEVITPFSTSVSVDAQQHETIENTPPVTVDAPRRVYPTRVKQAIH